MKPIAVFYTIAVLVALLPAVARADVTGQALAPWNRP
jgi:hypothetical protein